MTRTIFRAAWIGCLTMLLAMLAAFAAMLVVMMLDPACGPGDSGGCAMGLVGVTLGAAVPGFVAGAAGYLTLKLWRQRARLPTIRQLRNWGRED